VAAFDAGGSPLYASLARYCATEPLVAEVAPDLRWDLPLRLFSGVHYLVLQRELKEYPQDGPALRGVLATHGEALARWLAEQPVQTNEAQRSWGLLPCFLMLAQTARRPLDLVELGSSAGLNLVFDRYRYRYGAGAWGPAGSALELAGDEVAAVPARLVATGVEIRSRVGIDRRPIDVTSPDGALLLESFVWADLPERIERLRKAVSIAAAEPPALVEGDYVEVLPRILAERADGALTVVYETSSLPYVEAERRAELLRVLDEAGTSAPLAWLTTETDEERGSYELVLRTWPEGGQRALGHVAFHGSWLDWAP
jgi:hypothetical protein